MFIEDIYNFLLFLKNQGQSRWFSPEEVIDAVNRASLDKYRTEYKLYEKTDKISDAMLPFKANKVLSSTDSFALPADYFNRTNVSVVVLDEEVIKEEYPADIKTDGEFLDSKISTLKPPTTEYPIVRFIDGKIEVLPTSATSLKLYYLKKPATANYAYEEVNEQIVFKENGSVDVEWPLTEHNDLIKRTLTYIGVPLSNMIFLQQEQLLNQQTGS